MPSPFPGMDPFIESQEWSDFHATVNSVMRELLAEKLRPAYTVRVERRVYVEHPYSDDLRAHLRVADVAIIKPDPGLSAPSGMQAAGVATIEPVACEVALSEERRESYLIIRDVESQQVVTVVETLSPANKRRNGAGWRKYLKKRKQVLDSESHFVEIDLLRGGTRMPILPRPQTPIGDYRVMVSRVEARPRVHVYAWPLMHVLPKIAVPLLGKDESVDLDLQLAFETVYERAAYELSINYTSDLEPPLPDEIKSWLQEQRRPA